MGAYSSAESLLELDERFEDTIEFFVHNLKRSLHLVKREAMIYIFSQHWRPSIT